MFKFKQKLPVGADRLFSSKLYNQDNFYPALLSDLRKAKKQVIIESPFITYKRLTTLLPTFRLLRRRHVQVVINTKHLDELEPIYRVQTEQAIAELQELGVLVLCTVGHHRKLAIIDRYITWEGSLNILSQNDSCEFMRRINSKQLASQMLDFLHLEEFIN